MRNKLKLSKNCQDKFCQNKDHATATEAITLESSCSNDAKSPEGVSIPMSAKDRYGSNPASAAGLIAKKIQPVQEERRRCCTENIKITPIFLCTTQRSMSKGSRRSKLCEPADKKKSVRPTHSCDSERLRGERLLSTCTTSRLIERDAPLLGKPSSLQNSISNKRKQANRLSESVSKRLKVSLSTERSVGVDHFHMPAQNVLESIVVPVKKQPSRSKLSRTHRLRQQSGDSVGLDSNYEGKPECTHQPPITRDTLREVSSVEDVLWTDKYGPQCSSEVNGNSLSVNKLYSWLKKWKLRADCDDRRKEKRKEENSNDSWDLGDFQGEAGADDDREENLGNTMLITGPPGVGKTASVYACAKELGFKIFEVNSSSQRNGCHVLSQLKEATQSHLVESSGKDPLKPAYFKNYTTTNCPTKSDTLLGKLVHPKNVISTTKKRAAQNSGRKRKANSTIVTLANYFKMKVKADRLNFGGLSPSKKPDAKTLGNPSPSWDQTEPRSKKTATSLILFEEVDVIFDHDVGFLAAIKTFMTTTKRPVILTTNDPSFRERFGCSLEEIIFQTPSLASLCSHLQLVGLAENAQLEFNDVSSLLRLTQGDVRRCLLQLQLWVHSGGGRASQSRGLIKEPTYKWNLNATQGEESLELKLPPCETGCSASMLGLTHMTQIQLLKHLKSPYCSEADMTKFLMLLAESWRRCVPLLYSNLELLLPTGAKATSVYYLDSVTSSGLASSENNVHIQLNENVSSNASAITCKFVRNVSRLSRRKCNTMSDTTSPCRLKQRISLNGAPSTAPGSSDETKQKADRVDTDCLVALADFFDAISYIDAMLLAAGPLVSGPCRPEAFVWTGAEIKDGLLDEMSEEGSRSWSQERLFNIQASVEGLAFHTCCCQMSESWTGAKKCKQEMEEKKKERLVERLGLPAASKRQNLNFTVQPLCTPSVSQRRYELSQKVFGSEYFSLLGNRQAVSVDYMPVLRAICRFQKAEKQKEEPLRYLNYFNTYLGLSKSTMDLLAEDFL
ncbi:ATPase family AAA domain-containing protein 5 Chromosome fragility-associated gene 1 protein [Channa argus]|uniref:ATPase family AAA domain-containing protein 5 Chromosome fragility-associated gene 1 protein n=1 Tax=Channa argus TaxID=215402 RepID=A0A6G1PBE9_CHAAH|nr:ATPase family AAA domain-containing protein 5 Chromosome fragility-associated gene 1 protein [Channa argus]